MPRETRFFECVTCEEQYDSWSGAEQCEWRHEYEKENAND